jgi:8-oxo-dGTP pyrophosphatase MutT (NUDIX family)
MTSLSKLPNFDPRKLPMRREDIHLPRVPLAQLTEKALADRFAAPPTWAPEVRVEPRFSGQEPVSASVLIALITREQPMLLLTQRHHQMSNHSGQIAFPGGKADVTDTDEVMTALRETYEEVGVALAHIEVLGKLPIYTTGSAFVVTPVVALLSPDYESRANASEVEDVFEVPLSFLMNPANHFRQSILIDGVQRHWFSMPYQDHGKERFIWGATAGMIRNLYCFLAA